MIAHISNLLQEKFLFFQLFLHSPKEMGSITPSSKYLAQAMVASIPWDDAVAIAELGCGTGVVTRHIKLSAKERTRIVLFEKDPVLRQQLACRFPEYATYPDAGDLQRALGTEGIAHLDAIVCGLPFFNFPECLRMKLLNEIVASLKPGGLFVAFQYSLQMRQMLKSYFHIEQIKLVPFNLPPAFVYVCRKKEQE